MNTSTRIMNLFFIGLFLITSVLLIQGTSTPTTERLSVQSPHFTADVILTNQTIWSDSNVNFNTSIDINGGGNLTIVNSTITFTNTSGFKLNNNSHLKLINSVIMSGFRGVQGTTNGTLDIHESTFTGFVNDVIRLQGNYDVSIDGTVFTNNLQDAVQVDNAAAVVNITNSRFENIGKDGINALNTKYFISNTVFANITDDGLQIEGNAQLTVRDSLIANTNSGDGIKFAVTSGTITIDNISITGTGDDGLQVVGATTTTITKSKFNTNSENGFESSLGGPVLINESTFNSNGIRGIELIGVSSVNITASSFVDNDDVGIFANNVTSLSVLLSNITHNALGGIYMAVVNSSEIHVSRFVSNSGFSINATDIGSGSFVDASNNYWGTLNQSQIQNFGNISISPILDESLQIPVTSSATSASSIASTATSDVFFAPIFGAIMSAGFILRFMRKKQDT